MTTFKPGDRVRLASTKVPTFGTVSPRGTYIGDLGTRWFVEVLWDSQIGPEDGGYLPENLELIEDSPTLPTDLVKALAEGGPKLSDEEVRVIDPETGGAKNRKNIELGFVDPIALMELGKVASMGSRKYEPFNYLKGFAWSLSYNALQRHLMQFWSGEDTDEESGLSHLSHAAFHCLALLSFVQRELGTDDRPPKFDPSATNE